MKYTKDDLLYYLHIVGVTPEGKTRKDLLKQTSRISFELINSSDPTMKKKNTMAWMDVRLRRTRFNIKL